MKIILITILILTIGILAITRRKGQNLRGSTDNPMKQNSEDKFLALLVKYNTDVELKLKNDICPLITNESIYKSKTYILLSDIRNEIKASGNSFNIDLESIEIIFDTKHPDKEATVIIKDKSRRYFTFYQVYYNGNPKINHIANSIWEIVGNESQFEHSLQSAEKTAKINFGTSIMEIIGNAEFVEFEIKYFKVEDYVKQLAELMKLSTPDFKINKVQIEKENPEFTYLKVTINNIENIIKIENTKWYDADFVTQMNQILKKQNSKYRMSLLYHDKYDEDYKIKFSGIEEYNKLRKNNYLIEHER